jgi:hypothetical protein
MSAACGELSSVFSVERGERLQDAQIAVGKAADEGRVEGLRHLFPGDREHVFVGELFVENDCVESFVHRSDSLAEHVQDGRDGVRGFSGDGLSG